MKQSKLPNDTMSVTYNYGPDHAGVIQYYACHLTKLFAMNFAGLDMCQAANHFRYQCLQKVSVRELIQ